MSHAHTHGHSHHHDHDHDHCHEHGIDQQQTTRTIVATIVLVALAVAEVIFGTALHNPAVVADGGHNISDGFFVGAGAIALWVIVSLRRQFPHWHAPEHNLEPMAAGMIALVTILLIGGVTGWQIVHGVSTHGTVAATILGLVGYGVNRALASWLGHASDQITRSMAAHLRTDAGASLWITAAAVATAVVAWPAWNIIAAVIIIWLALKHNWPVVRTSADNMHRKVNCPG